MGKRLSTEQLFAWSLYCWLSRPKPSEKIEVFFLDLEVVPMIGFVFRQAKTFEGRTLLAVWVHCLTARAVLLIQFPADNPDGFEQATAAEGDYKTHHPRDVARWLKENLGLEGNWSVPTSWPEGYALAWPNR